MRSQGRGSTREFWLERRPKRVTHMSADDTYWPSMVAKPATLTSLLF